MSSIEFSEEEKAILVRKIQLYFSEELEIEQEPGNQVSTDEPAPSL